jgi:hypothetical protein
MAHHSNIETVADILRLWPSRPALADDITEDGDAVTAGRIHKWARSESIPSRYHGRILRAAQRRGYALSPEDLVRAHDACPAAPPASEEDAA